MAISERNWNETHHGEPDEQRISAFLAHGPESAIYEAQSGEILDKSALSVDVKPIVLFLRDGEANTTLDASTLIETEVAEEPQITTVRRPLSGIKRIALGIALLGGM